MPISSLSHDILSHDGVDVDNSSPQISKLFIPFTPLLYYPVRHYGAESQPSPEGAERDSSHRASGLLPDERHGSAPTAALQVTDQTTEHVQASDAYFQGEVPLDPTVSSRTASRPPGCQGTSIYYRSTVLPTICVHRLRLSGVLLLCTSSLELSRDIHKIGEHFQ